MINNETSYFIVFENNNYCINENYLNFIYKPIIGSDSYSLYRTLFLNKEVFIDKKNYTIDDLKIFTNMKINSIKKSIKKLEAISLIETFFNKDDNEIFFKLITPNNYENFILNKKFKKLLKKKTNKYYLNILKKLFSLSKIEDDNRYKKFINISHEFDEKIFDDKKFDINSVKNIYLKDNKQKIIDLKLQEMNKYSTYEYFSMLKGNNLNKNEIDIVVNLNKKLSKSVSNCLLEYVYLKNNKFIKKLYIMKIASSMSELNIDNSKDAMKYLKQAYNASKNKRDNFSQLQNENNFINHNNVIKKEQSDLDVSNTFEKLLNL